ncbi:rplB [Symbiodinium natans]|uniref:RplB protein n=1 Tax=Symbiodinium natans TaxID=878477 RepID=A0A812LRL1_9DINO|nr:rplB [Symbiodinium natans]
MTAIPGLWLANGTFSKEYTCEAGNLGNLIPEFHWGGPKVGCLFDAYGLHLTLRSARCVKKVESFRRLHLQTRPGALLLYTFAQHVVPAMGRCSVQAFLAGTAASLAEQASPLPEVAAGVARLEIHQSSSSYSRIMKRNRVPYIDFETGFPKEEAPKQTVGTAFTLAKQQKLERLLEATPQSTFRGRVIKQLSTRRIRHSGRGDVGRITTRHREGGTMQRLRFVDFKRARKDIPASVLRIEYSPERTSHVALIQYQDGVLSYILAPLTLRPGDQAGSRKQATFHFFGGS